MPELGPLLFPVSLHPDLNSPPPATRTTQKPFPESLLEDWPFRRTETFDINN